MIKEETIYKCNKCQSTNIVKNGKRNSQQRYKEDVLELDQLWSLVQNKDNERDIWLAICRRTKQIVAYYIGDRSEEIAGKLIKMYSVAVNIKWLEKKLARLLT